MTPTFGQAVLGSDEDPARTWIIGRSYLTQDQKHLTDPKVSHDRLLPNPEGLLKETA